MTSVGQKTKKKNKKKKKTTRSAATRERAGGRADADHSRDELSFMVQLSTDVQHLLESTGVATLFLDRELKIVHFTQQAAEMFNIRRTDTGRRLSDLRHCLDYGDLLSDARRVLDELTPVDREVAGADKRWFLAKLHPYRTVAQRVDGVVLTLVEVTARKHAEDRLREADRRKDEFLALLAHELRNPLAPISAGVEVLKRAGSDPRVVAQVSATMGRQTRQLVRLVDDLLDVSRVRGGRLRLRLAQVNLADVIRDAVAAVRPLTETSGHELTIDLPDEPILMKADSARLTQVVANLLNNAARYTPRNGTIRIAVTRGGDEAIVSIRDTGMGIPPETLGRVFEMFYQGNDARVARNAGLGIGLTLAKSLVEMHGGRIAIASEGVDRGSVATVRLPIAPNAEDPVPQRVRIRPENVGGHRVLIVDDNRDAADTLSLVVQTLGANEVRTEFSGAAALDAMPEFRPDVVLLDLKMPGMDGYEVARRIRATPWGRQLLLVALTGLGQEEHKRRSKEAGFDHHLTKPADRAAIEAVLSECHALESAAS